MRRLSQQRPGRWLVLAVVVVVAALAGLWLLRQALPPAVDPTWERIQASGALTVCTDPSWPPFEFIDENTGRSEGFDVDLARLLAQRLVPGGQAQIVTVGFDGLYDALLAGRCDAILSALPYESLRTQDVAYSVAYFNAGMVLVTRAEATDIERLPDLTGRTVGVEWGFVPQGDSRRRLFFDGLGLRRYDTAEDTLRALQAGEIEVAIVDRITALVYLRDCQGLQIVGQPLTDINYVIPVRPDSFRLLEEINNALLEMRQDGTLEVLQERWF